MKIHDEMSQISVPEDLDEKTYQSILSAEKTVQKNRFRKKCVRAHDRGGNQHCARQSPL